MLLVAYLASSCTRDAPSRAEATCDERADSFGRWAELLAAEGVGWVGGAVRPVAVDLPATGGHGTFVKVTPAAVTLNGEPIGDPSEQSSEELAAVLESSDPIADPDPSIILLVDERTTWSSFERVAGALRIVGVDHVDLAFIGRSGVSAPANAKPLPLSDSLAGCAPALAFLERVAGLDPERKVRAIGQQLPLGLKECGCRVDLERVKIALWQLMFRHEGLPIATVRLEISEPADARVVFPANTEWGQAYATVLDHAQAGRRIALAVLEN